jgi:hypothetical protein
MKDDQVGGWVEVLAKLTLEGIAKIKFTKCTDGTRKRLRSLTKVC